MADEAVEHAADFVGCGGKGACVGIGDTALGGKETQTGQGLGDGGPSYGVVAGLGSGIRVASAFGDVEEDAGGRTSDLVLQGEVTGGLGHHFPYIYHPGHGLRFGPEFADCCMLFHALSYRNPVT